jgi:hypothetical protein
MTLAASATLTAGNFTLTYTYQGTAYTTASLPYTCTAAAAATAIVNALATFPGGAALASDVNTSGGPVSAPATPISVSLSERFIGGVWSVTPTGITGGTLSITQPLWTPVGATDQGWTFASNKSTQAINIEEQSSQVAMEMTTQSLTVSGALSEDISQTLAMAYNMIASYTTPGVGVGSTPGYTLLNPTDTILTYAVALIMANRLTYPRWLYIPVATCLANVSGAFRRAAAKRMYTADFQSVCPISQIAVYDFTAPHT